MNIFILQYLTEIVFLTIVFLHITKKNFGAVLSYNVQSLVITVMLFNSYLETGNIYLLLISFLALIVKVILAPIFFVKLVKKHELIFAVSTYLNTPITLIIIAILTYLANSQKFLPLTNLIVANHLLLVIALSSIFLSLFLIVNRKGALSQILGILSFENSIVVFTLFSGLEQSPAFQIGIIFNIAIWIIIATVFISMIYKHFGSLDVTSMKLLKD